MKVFNILKNLINIKARNIDSVREIGYEELINLKKNCTDLVIVDIRSPQEYAEKKVKNAINIPLYELNKNESLKLLPNKNELIVLYCGCGVRSKKAYKILEKMGYTNLYSLKGGIDNI